jgi:hypothetical protein
MKAWRVTSLEPVRTSGLSTALAVFWLPAGEQPFLDWLNHMFSLTSISQTINALYGDNEQTFLVDHAQSVTFVPSGST